MRESFTREKMFTKAMGEKIYQHNAKEYVTA